ncbi:hypothetical protein DV738_g1117, partial [Chaetothyriales sp. CBS 135597]
MEADRRPFQAVNIGLSSVESGSDRYARDNFSRPPHSNWRCNLTALSQRYNLYFMASREDILVFEPEFPFQKLGKTPKLLIPPALAEPLAFGYLDSLGDAPGPHPHAINHLLVGDLGSEEILLLSTDSGNIAAYHTKAILDAAQKDPFRFSQDGRADLVGLRPFLSHWIYESAWGLAIHREARMIAASANTPTFIQTSDPSAKITVFAFALTSPPSYPATAGGDGEPTVSSKDQTEWHKWVPAAHNETIPRRDRNYKIVLAGENGHTTNIPSISFVNTREDPDGSWLLSCDIHGDLKCWQIWKGTCFRTWDFAETCQIQKKLESPGLKAILMRKRKIKIQGCHVVSRYVNVRLQDAPNALVEVQQLSGHVTGDNDMAASTSEPEFMDTESDHAENLEPIGRTQRTSIEVETGALPPTASPEISGDDGERSQSKTCLAKRSLQSQSGLVDAKPVRIPSIPTLHLSQSHLRLINLPHSRSPHFFCANILKQELPDLYNNMQNNSLQRLNMLQQIPELGIIVIGSQLGRVAVCSLTRAIPSGILGIRVDWILPTRRQERNGARPRNHELLGIAPKQGEGWEAIEGSRRYRLMMTYSDMTVLTYEVGRGLERDEIAVTGQGRSDMEA